MCLPLCSPCVSRHTQEMECRASLEAAPAKERVAYERERDEWCGPLRAALPAIQRSLAPALAPLLARPRRVAHMTKKLNMNMT